jgi:LPS sulfotransferase NodH
VTKSNSRPIIICNTPRSGSTLLSSLLVESGRCTGGDEYFECLNTIPSLVFPKFGIESVELLKADVDAYVAKIKQTWGAPNQPLCVKIQWYQLEEWRPHGLDLQRHFPNARYVLSTRSNLASQSISLVKALQTGEWRSTQQADASPPQFGFWRVMWEMGRLAREEDSWENWFREHGIGPYRLRYEELDADYRAEAIKLLEWLGEKLGPFQKRKLKATLRKQRDKMSREWEHRFYRDLIHWHTQWEKLPLEERRRIWGREPG